MDGQNFFQHQTLEFLPLRLPCRCNLKNHSISEMSIELSPAEAQDRVGRLGFHKRNLHTERFCPPHKFFLIFPKQKVSCRWSHCHIQIDAFSLIAELECLRVGLVRLKLQEKSL